MSEFQPVSTKDDLENLDQDEMVEGYRAGLEGTAEPGSDKSRAYWHGWRNGMADKGRLPFDGAMARLAREVVGTYRGLH